MYKIGVVLLFLCSFTAASKHYINPDSNDVVSRQVLNNDVIVRIETENNLIKAYLLDGSDQNTSRVISGCDQPVKSCVLISPKNHIHIRVECVGSSGCTVSVSLEWQSSRSVRSLIIFAVSISVIILIAMIISRRCGGQKIQSEVITAPAVPSAPVYGLEVVSPQSYANSQIELQTVYPGVTYQYTYFQPQTPEYPGHQQL